MTPVDDPVESASAPAGTVTAARPVARPVEPSDEVYEGAVHALDDWLDD